MACIIGVVLIAVVPRASAGPQADAIARHGDVDVAALRAKLPGDLGVRCTLGTVYAKRGDLPRAALYLADCAAATLPDDIALEVLRATRETKKKLRDSLMSELSITSRPIGMTAEVDSLPGEPLITPVTVWVKAGLHTVTASAEGKTITNTVTTQPYSRGTIWLDAGAPQVTAPPQDSNLDFADENAREASETGAPPDVVRPSIMSDKLRGVVPRGGPVLEDPLATRPAPLPIAMWLGVRIGGGMFDDAFSSAHVRPSLAAAARFELSGSVFVAARLDWTRRGGASSDTSIDSIDTLGASAGVGTTLLDRSALAIAVIGQLRGDLRFADTRDAMAVRRAGASLAAGIEVAFPTTPLTAGVRYEQGLTELVAGARDRALLVELGVDWR